MCSASFCGRLLICDEKSKAHEIEHMQVGIDLRKDIVLEKAPLSNFGSKIGSNGLKASRALLNIFYIKLPV